MTGEELIAVGVGIAIALVVWVAIEVNARQSMKQAKDEDGKRDLLHRAIAARKETP